MRMNPDTGLCDCGHSVLTHVDYPQYSSGCKECPRCHIVVIDDLIIDTNPRGAQ